MQSIVVESSVEIKTAVIKHRKDWVEDRNTKKMKRVDVPISDRVKPSYHVHSYDGMVAGRSSRMRSYTLVFTEAHFANKEINDKGPNGEIITRPFTFEEGMEMLFTNPGFLDNFIMRKACLKVAPSNVEILNKLIDKKLIKPEWIGNQAEFLKMIQGDTSDQFVEALKSSVASIPAPKPDPGNGIASSKALQEAQAALALKEQEAETEAKLNPLPVPEDDPLAHLETGEDPNEGEVNEETDSEDSEETE